jgi:hypothetical protein
MAMGYKIYQHTNTDQPKRHKYKKINQRNVNLMMMMVTVKNITTRGVTKYNSTQKRKCIRLENLVKNAKNYVNSLYIVMAFIIIYTYIRTLVST